MQARARRPRPAAALARVLLALAACPQCYSVRSNGGGADLRAPAPRRYDAAAIAVPAGYRAELVARDLVFPTGLAFDGDGRAYVVESGYSYGEVWTTPRLLRLEADGRRTLVVAGERADAPWNGVAFGDGAFFVAAGGVLSSGKILRVEPSGEVRVLVDDLPSVGDHQANGPALGPDGDVYFGVGTATNSGVVGPDGARFGWLPRRPEFHDVPGADVVLAGRNFESADVLAGEGTARTGAYSPFGVPTEPGEVVRGRVRCSGSVLRVAPGGGEPELVAWGFRNPFGLAFAPDGALHVTENGYDDRGSRPVWGAADFLWRVEPGLWYGFPDFAGGVSLADARYAPPGGEAPGFLLAEHPNEPPRPLARLAVHAAAGGLDFSRSAAFGHVGDAFVALFGDQSPSTGKVLAPVGFEVVRVEPERGTVHGFAANRGCVSGPASRRDGRGLERPIAVRFDPTGAALYVVDFGVLTEQESGSVPLPGTGCVWRITRATRAVEGAP